MDTHMLAAVFEGNGKLELRQRTVPAITRADDVLLEVEIASVCGTDVQILAVPPGHPATDNAILGHEYVGTVIDAGNDVSGLSVGDRVVVNPNLTCGQCAYCRRSMPNLCKNMTTLGIFIDGGFARYNCAPADALFRISKEVPLEEAIFAEPLSCVLNGIGRLAPLPGESALVLGAGPIGLYFISILRMEGLEEILVSEPNPDRARMAKTCGATEVIDPGRTDIGHAVRERTDVGPDIVIDTVGSLLTQAISSVCRGGRILLFGMNSKAMAEVRQNDITRNEIEILGSFIANNTFPETVSLLESGSVELRKLVTHRFKLNEIHAAVEAMRKGEAIKVLVDPFGD